MAKFQYRMQSILNIKLKMEEQAKMQFAQAQAKVNEEEAKLQALVERKNMYETELKEVLQKKLDLLKIDELQNALMRMEEYIVEEKEKLHHEGTSPAPPQSKQQGAARRQLAKAVEHAGRRCRCAYIYKE